MVTMEFRTANAFRGHRIQSAGDEVGRTRTYGSGRVCAVEGCGTRLSAYNPSDVCALHSGSWQDDLQQLSRRGAQREEITRRCAFEPCGREFTTTNPAKKYCSDACRMRAFQARVSAARRMGQDAVLQERRAS
jgi:hypothetical protein